MPWATILAGAGLGAGLGAITGYFGGNEVARTVGWHRDEWKSLVSLGTLESHD